MDRIGRTLVCLALLLFGSHAADAGAETVVYYHTDALGSPVAVTDANRNVIERTQYAPYGDTLNRPLHDGPGYTGHETDAATGLVYAQQRYYDPVLGRFLSADPVVADAATGDNFNRFRYANDNPYRYMDPDGRYTCSGGKNDCAQIDKFVSTIKKAMKNLDRKSDGYKKLSAVSKYLGKAGEKNGVTVIAASLEKGTLAEAAPNGQISVDIKQTTNLDSAFYSANPGRSASDVQNAVGAGAVAHEARHELDFNRLGVPSTKKAEYQTELNAYTVQSVIGKGLGVEIGVSTPAEIAAGAQASVDAWCQGNSACH